MLTLADAHGVPAHGALALAHKERELPPRVHVRCQNFFRQQPVGDQRKGSDGLQLLFLSFMRDHEGQNAARIWWGEFDFLARLEIVFHSREWKRVSRRVVRLRCGIQAIFRIDLINVAQTLLSVPVCFPIIVGHRQECLCHKC